VKKKQVSKATWAETGQGTAVHEKGLGVRSQQGGRKGSRGGPDLSTAVQKKESNQEKKL